MPTTAYIDANGQTKYRLVSGSGTQADPHITNVNIESLPALTASDRYILIPKAASDISIATSLSTILILNTIALDTVSLTLRNTGATNPLTSFRISGTRGTSYNQLLILAQSDDDFTTLLGTSTGNRFTRVIEATPNPRSLAAGTDASLVINVRDLASIVLAATSAGTTMNYEGINLLL